MNKPCPHVKAEQISHLIIKRISAMGVLTLKSSMDELKRLASKDHISDNDRIVINVLSGKANLKRDTNKWEFCNDCPKDNELTPMD